MLGAASGCICRVEVVNHMSTRSYKKEELHNQAAQQQQPVRSMALHGAQQFRPARVPPEQARHAAADATLARLDGARDEYLGEAPAPKPDESIRIWSPCCPNPCSSRICTSRAATGDMPRGNAAAACMFGAVSGCICRVEVVIHMSTRSCRQEELHNRAAQQQQQVRSMAL